MPITKIRSAKIVVAWDSDQETHVYRSDCDVVMRDDQIAYIGEAYTGHFDREIDGAGFMVMPGFVNIHAHPGHEPINKGLWDEIGSPKLYNSSLYEHLAVFKPDIRGAQAAYKVALSETLLSGVTTVCDLAVQIEGAILEDGVDLLAQSGLRAYYGPMFRSGRWFTENGYRVDYEFDEKAGYRDFETSLRLIDRAEAVPGGRLKGMICPAQIDTCTEGLLRDAHAEARRRGLPFQTHAAQSLVEFQEMVRRHGMTPIEWMASLDLLGPDTIIGHGIFLDHHAWTRWPTRNDLGRLAETGSTVAHCPTVFARRGITLRDFGGYRDAGVNVGVGTDSYPHRMIEEMRLLIFLARTVSESYGNASVGEVFHAATVGGAKALNRSDIGRLAVGAKADIVMVDCTVPAMRPLYDPLRSLILSADDRAVRHVFVDGVQRVRDGQVLSFDYAAAAAELEEAQQRGLSMIGRLDWAGRSARDIAGSAIPWA